MLKALEKLLKHELDRLELKYSVEELTEEYFETARRKINLHSLKDKDNVKSKDSWKK